MSQSLNLSQVFKTSWEELKVRDCLSIVQILALMGQVDASAKDSAGLKYQIMQRLAREPYLLKKLTPEQLFDCFRDLKFLEEGPGFWLLPHIWLGWVKWTAHRPMFEDFSYYRFTRADAYLARYFLTGERYWALKAFVVVYRPRHLFRLTPRPFNELCLDQEAKAIRLHEVFLSAFILSFLAMRSRIIRLFPYVFPQGEPKDTKPTDPLPAYDQQMIYLAHSPAFPGMNAARNAPFYDALKYLNERLKHE